MHKRAHPWKVSCTCMAMYLSLFLHVAMNRETVKCYVLKIWKFLVRLKAFAPPRPPGATCTAAVAGFHLPIMLCALRLAWHLHLNFPEFRDRSSATSPLCGVCPIGFASSNVALDGPFSSINRLHCHTYRLRSAESWVNLWLYRLHRAKCWKLII